jgi:hypothetical protein
MMTLLAAMQIPIVRVTQSDVAHDLDVLRRVV